MVYIILFYLLIFIIGLCIGSFLNVCIYRIPREESIIFPSSHCTNCNNRLVWKDLIPIASYLLLKGECRYCKEKISPRYAIIELITAISYVLVFIKYGFSLYSFKYLILISLLIVISLIDIDTMSIYLKTTVFGVVSGVVLLAMEGISNGYGVHNYLYYFLGGIIPAIIITLIILMTRGMGWGDVEIFFICGLFLGVKLSMVMTFLSFIIGAIISLCLLYSKKKTRKDPIPFGPFIALGAFFAILMGDAIVNLYMSLYINLI